MKAHYLAGLFAAAVLCVGGVASADTFKIDPAHAAATFQISHLNISTTHGRFNTIRGSFEEGKRVSVEIDAASIDSGDAKRDKHLRGPDFFNVKKHPKLSFISSKWTLAQSAAGQIRYDVTGVITIHGVSQTITVSLVKVGEGDDPWGGHRAGFDTTFTIKRADYGMNFMPGGLGAEVKISLSLEGVRG